MSSARGSDRGRFGSGLLVLAVAWLAGAAHVAAGEIGPRLERRLEREPGGVHLVWVFFRDKPDSQPEQARATLAPRALSRRALRGTLAGAVGFADLPVAGAYLAAVERHALHVRHVSRWLNAASLEADAGQIGTLAALPFVERLELVRRFRRGPEPTTIAAPELALLTQPAGLHALDYGLSFDQVSQIRVPELHDLGLTGEGVIVAVFDSGFDNLAHEVFATTQILAAHDFVNGDDDVSDHGDRGEGDHGTATLSVLGGFRPGQLIGPAYAATFVLAKTEDSTSETPVEEDHWAAAAEWAEALGADVISSSLGYSDFDAPFDGYTPEELNGEIAVSTRAADLAAERGVVVVNSAGNGGFDPARNTLGAPADGKRVLAIGAVTATGARSTFSSVGPTPDGRIKPDLAARGSGVRVANSPGLPPYGFVHGTSFSCPLVAGVAAQVLQAHPDYTVAQVHAVLRATASQASTPDNLLGWGIVNALAAIQVVPE